MVFSVLFSFSDFLRHTEEVSKTNISFGVIKKLFSQHDGVAKKLLENHHGTLTAQVTVFEQEINVPHQ